MELVPTAGLPASDFAAVKLTCATMGLSSRVAAGRQSRMADVFPLAGNY